MSTINTITDNEKPISDFHNAIKNLFSIKDFPTFPIDFPNKQNLSKDEVIHLLVNGTKDAWEMYANRDSGAIDVSVQNLLDNLYTYLNNPDYPGPLSDEFTEEENTIYNYITQKLSGCNGSTKAMSIIPRVNIVVSGVMATKK